MSARSWYQNIRSTLFGFVTKHACDKRTDRQTGGRTELLLSRPRYSIAAWRGEKRTRAVLCRGRAIPAIKTVLAVKPGRVVRTRQALSRHIVTTVAVPIAETLLTRTTRSQMWLAVMGRLASATFILYNEWQWNRNESVQRLPEHLSIIDVYFISDVKYCVFSDFSVCVGHADILLTLSVPHFSDCGKNEYTKAFGVHYRPCLSLTLSHIVVMPSLAMHIARLDTTVSAHQALRAHVNLSLGRNPDPTWKLRPGRPRCRWIDQIRKDNNDTPPADLWRREIGRGHGESLRPKLATRWTTTNELGWHC